MNAKLVFVSVGMVRDLFATVQVPVLLAVVPSVHVVDAGYFSAQVTVKLPAFALDVVPDCVT